LQNLVETAIVERHLEIRKTAEDEKDLTVENHPPAYDVMLQKHNSQQKDTHIDDDGQEYFYIFV
jgi:hypothetical protein